jgi:hypothetical protein
MHGAIPPLSQYVFISWCLVKQWIPFALYLVKHKNDFTFISNLYKKYFTVHNPNMYDSNNKSSFPIFLNDLKEQIPD